MRFTTEALTAGAAALGDVLTAHRRTIHRTPELALAEHRTAAYIEAQLDRLGIPHRRAAGTGVVAVIAGRGDRCVGIRADMDALPVEEAPGREGYRSEVPGVAHVCGHDGHVAVLLGLAELLVAVDDLPGTVVCYFQPAEEGVGGAQPMVEEGVLDDPTPQAILALHTASNHPSGVIGLRRGPVTGSMDSVAIVVHGAGGHAAHPHLALDPVPIAAELVLAAQRIVTREISPVKPALVTFGTIRGGTQASVIAPSVHLGATVRAVHPEVRAHLLERLAEVAHGVAATHRARAEVAIGRGFAPGANDPGLAALVGRAARAVVGDRRLVWEPEPSLGAEDFFDFGATGIPVCMFRLGVADAARGITAPHHSPDFDLDEGALPVGVAVFAEAVRRLLAGEEISPAA
jgi:amidohydrolase